MYSKYEHPVQLIAQYNDNAIDRAGILKYFLKQNVHHTSTHNSHIECKFKKKIKK